MRLNLQLLVVPFCCFLSCTCERSLQYPTFQDRDSNNGAPQSHRIVDSVFFLPLFPRSVVSRLLLSSLVASRPPPELLPDSAQPRQLPRYLRFLSFVLQAPYTCFEGIVRLSLRLPRSLHSAIYGRIRLGKLFADICQQRYPTTTTSSAL